MSSTTVDYDSLCDRVDTFFEANKSDLVATHAEHHVKNEDDPSELNSYDAHEALDRASIIIDIFNNQFNEHIFVKSTPELAARACLITILLNDLYLTAGKITI